ncbi:hypothetical protein [Dactylosporangium sp. NPDC006015]|uniref:hypothetical protein n=1 Tax=Dactylosporangium sp. NPDC006015 TaxID=3154576 RepID=UPI0033BE1D35
MCRLAETGQWLTSAVEALREIVRRAALAAAGTVATLDETEPTKDHETAIKVFFCPDPGTDFDHGRGLLLTSIQARLATATAQ